MKSLDISKFRPKKVTIPPPDTLDSVGAALWNELQSEYQIDDPGGRTALLSACRAESDVVRMRSIVAADGDVQIDRFGQSQPHCLLAAIARSEAVKRQALRSLNLDVIPVKEPHKGEH